MELSALGPRLHHMRGKLIESWGKLTRDQQRALEGRREQLEARIRARPGMSEDDAKRHVQAWLKRQKVPESTTLAVHGP